jgi:hypothetical protein
MSDLTPASGLGTARPSFVHNERSGATATPSIPTLQPMQFGAMPNWGENKGPEVNSALLNKPQPA